MNGFQDNVLHLSCPRLARGKTTIAIRREAAGWARVGQLSTGPESIENEFEHRGMEGTHWEHSFEYFEWRCHGRGPGGALCLYWGTCCLVGPTPAHCGERCRAPSALSFPPPTPSMRLTRSLAPF